VSVRLLYLIVVRVFGWPAGDGATGFAATLTDLAWTAGQASGQTARASVFQGSAFAVPWQPGGPPPPSPKDGVNPSIAIGATGIDAFVAFVRAALSPALPSVPWTNLPAVGPALVGELFLLDPANVAQLAAAAGQTLTSAQLTSAARSMSPPVPVAGHGTVASPLAPFPWSQPWRPL